MNFEIMREGKVIPEIQFEGDTHWKKFKQRFKILNNASEGNKKEQKTQISMLLHLMGEEGIELYNTIDWKGGKEEDRKLEDVLMKFDEVFLLQKNDLFEHYKFLNVKQKEGQSIMSYLKELKLLISTCNFKDRDILLRDKFIFGLLDQAQVEKCLRDPDITLDKAINQARAAEAASEEMKMMRNKQMMKYELTHEIDNVNRSDFTGRRANCSRCSRVHVRGVCPAAEEICYVMYVRRKVTMREIVSRTKGRKFQNQRKKEESYIVWPKWT
ncbi:hypothetical protein M8J77_008038 [Diaphorina citri]|nr:hypothetical protein M8J77_008038 [Diaphorina citri]